jgi:hypothetical protein
VASAEDGTPEAHPLARFVGKSFDKILKNPEVSLDQLIELEPAIARRPVAPPPAAGDGTDSDSVGDAPNTAANARGPRPEAAGPDEASDAAQPDSSTYPVEWLRQVELDVKYEGYVAREEKMVKRFRRMENMRIPRDFDWDALTGISNEAREKFKSVQPASVGQASRISGVRNSDVTVLLVTLGRGKKSA